MKCLYILTKKTLSLSLSLSLSLYIYIYIHIFFFLSKRTGKDSSSVLVIVPKVNTGPDKIKILNRITLIKIKQHIIEPYPFSFFLFLVKNLFHYISRYHTNKITIHLESPLDSKKIKKLKSPLALVTHSQALSTCKPSGLYSNLRVREQLTRCKSKPAPSFIKPQKLCTTTTTFGSSKPIK